MATAIKMPRLSDTMLEGNIKSWNKKVGDSVKPGDILAEVETDKATMDLEAYEEGTLLHIAVAEGPVAVDGLIAIIGKPNEDFSGLLQGDNKSENAKTSEAVKETKEPSAKTEPEGISNNSQDSQNSNTDTDKSSTEDQRIKASPLAKNMAKEKGIALNTVTGSGDKGRIIRKDIETIPAESKSTVTTKTQSASAGDETITLSQMRKTIARRLSESKFSAPHFYLTTEVDMDACVNARNQLNEISETRISFNDIIVKACALAIKTNPNVNVSWMGDKMLLHHDINIGVAVAIEEGLVVPVINFADTKSLTSLNIEINDKAMRAKERKLNLDEMQGNTFTISNLGMFDIEHFTAIINPPDACILAVGSIIKKPSVKNDQIVISSKMKLTLSCDHRAVDGATGAKFMKSLKSLLENPMSMLL